MSPEEWTAIAISLKVSTIAVLLSFPLAIGIAWLLARKSFFGKTLLETIVYMPLVLPPVVTGYLLLYLLGRRGTIGSFLNSCFGLDFIFDWKGAAIASAIVSFPLLVRSIRIGFASVDKTLEDAASTLGASPARVFMLISLPLAWQGIIAGIILAFARCLGEFGATIMVAGNVVGETQTIPLYVYDALQSPGGIDRAAGVLAFSIGISAIAIFSGQWLEHRSRTHLK